MATVKLIVRTSIKDKLAPVYLRYRHGRSIDITIQTEFLIFPTYWNNKTQSFSKRIIYTDRFTPIEKDNLDMQFRDIKNFVLNEFNSGVNSSKETLSNIIYKYHHPGIRKGSVDFNTYMDLYITNCESGKLLTEKKTKYQASTIKNLKGLKYQLEAFQKFKKRRYNFNDIDMDFYDDLVYFFNRKDYSPNTIGRHIKYLKKIVRTAREDGLHNNFEIEKKVFKAPNEPVDKIYLTKEELQLLHDLDLAENKVLDKVRDVFLAGCYIAQRFSDYSRIGIDHIKFQDGKAKYIELIQQKTKEKVIIPISSRLDRILKKYDYSLPKLHEQKVNMHIKEIGRMAGIDEIIISVVTKGGKKVELINKKHELIQTHTARRSGCTNMHLAGISPIDIMKFSGHKTEKEFMKYIKVTKQETAQNLANHVFFND